MDNYIVNNPLISVVQNKDVFYTHTVISILDVLQSSTIQNTIIHHLE